MIPINDYSNRKKQNEMNFAVREAVHEDFAEVNKLIYEVHQLHRKNRPDVYLDLENPLKREEFDTLLSSGNTKLFVVQNEDSKEIVAYSQLQIMKTQNPIYIPKTYVYIDGFCVKSSCKRSGVGKLLFRFVVEYAKAQNAASLQLTVWEFNQDAIRFYEAMGMSTRNRHMELGL